MSRILRIKELCTVDYINENKYDEEIKIEDLKAIRVVEYETEKNTLIEALKDYENNFDCDSIAYTWDEFDGGCLDSEIIYAEMISKFDEIEIEHINSKE